MSNSTQVSEFGRTSIMIAVYSCACLLRFTIDIQSRHKTPKKKCKIFEAPLTDVYNGALARGDFFARKPFDPSEAWKNLLCRVAEPKLFYAHKVELVEAPPTVPASAEQHDWHLINNPQHREQQ